MRTRIALAAAVAVTFMITSTGARPAAAQAAREKRTDQPGAGASRLAHAQLLSAGNTAAGNAAAGVATIEQSIDRMLLPQLIAIPVGPAHNPAAAASAEPSPAPASTGAAATATPAPAPAPAATPPAPAPAPAPSPPVTDATSTGTTDWQCIRVHESGDEYNDPSRPSGAYGILESTWLSYGYSGWPYQAPAPVQDALALELYNEYGWDPWSTATVCGLS